MLSLYADFPEEFDTGTPLLVTIDALEVPLYCERFERRGTSGAVASFAGKSRKTRWNQEQNPCEDLTNNSTFPSRYFKEKSLHSISRSL